MFTVQFMIRVALLLSTGEFLFVLGRVRVAVVAATNNPQVVATSVPCGGPNWPPEVTT